MVAGLGSSSNSSSSLSRRVLGSLAIFVILNAPAIQAATLSYLFGAEDDGVTRKSIGYVRVGNAAAVEATATDATAYLRIASLSIALYDFLMTIPAEIRLYASQPGFFKMSRACVLFICVRYMSIAALVTSNWGFFGTGFSESVCKHYQLVAPLTKLFAVLFSQVIVSIRTYAISRKEQWVLWVLVGLFIGCMVPEFLGNVYKRIPVQNSKGNCTSGNIVKVAWVHYLAAVIFDAAAMSIATFYLLLNSPSLSLMSGLSRLMLKEGMAYFLILTAVNVLNLVLFRVSPIATQSSAASLGQAVTMIMSQHIILSLHDWRSIASGNSGARHPSSNHEMNQFSGSGGNAARGRGLSALGPNIHSSGVGITTFLGAGSRRDDKTYSTSMGPGAQSKHGRGTSLVQDFTRSKRSSTEDTDRDGKLEIRVQVEEEVKLDYDSVYGPPGVAVSHDSESEPSHLESQKDSKWRPV